MDTHADAASKDKGGKDDDGHGRDEIILEVATPKGPWTGAFPKTTTILDVITTVTNALGLEGESYQLIVNGNPPLEPVTRTLVSFGFEGRVKLSLVATGSGV